MSNAEIDIDHPTRRQHYVPRLYLKNWCGANARFAVAEDGEVRDRETTKGHAYGEFYYEACDLTPDELQCLFSDVSRSFPGEYDLVRYLFAQIYLAVLGYRCELSDGVSEYRSIFEAIEARWPLTSGETEWKNVLLNHISGIRHLTDDALKELHYHRKTIFERYEGRIESDANVLIEKAVKENLSFMKNRRDAFHFLHFILNLSTRVPDYISFLQDTLPGQTLPKGTTAHVGEYIRYFLPLCSAHLLVMPEAMETHKMTLIRNATGHEFITGDVPVAVVGAEQGMTRHNVNYFPLSPHRAIVFGFKNAVNEFIKITRLSSELKDESLVKTLNNVLLHNCTSAVFASNGKFLRENNYVPLKL